MYAPFFGLSKEPFSIAPDPHFLYMSEQHREALAHLLYGLGGGGGFVLLTGEIGAGKTTVCRCFLEQLPASCTVAYIFNPKLTAHELLQTVCAEFGLSPGPGTLPGVDDQRSIKAHVDALNAFLLAAHAQGRQAVLVIDEAQSLSADVLEQLRLLTNLETAERKLLQIVLIGQPELRDMLARPGLEQLAQRVIARYHLGALPAAETQHYIRHRMAVAGTGAQLPFDAPALARIHTLSRGVPRRINLLADRALLGAYAQGQARADRRTVDQAALEVFGERPRAFAPTRWPLAWGTLVLGVGLGWGLTAGLPARQQLATAPAKGQAAAPAAGIAPALAPAAWAAASAAVVARAASAAVPLSDPSSVLAAAQAAPATAWRELALLWHLSIGEGEPCLAVAQAQLACLRSPAGGLPAVRQLARPGLLTLHGDGGAVVYAQLLALGDASATLQAGNQRFELTLPALARIWRGEFATLWRTPPGWRAEGGLQRDAALQVWVADHLPASGAPGKPSLSERVRLFQLAQGLPPDGVAGPLTLIALMRLTATGGAAEPRLGATP
jgi:general secretion pathway protein A